MRNAGMNDSISLVFQSAPGREAGRCAFPPRMFTMSLDVSIRARP